MSIGKTPYAVSKNNAVQKIICDAFILLISIQYAFTNTKWVVIGLTNIAFLLVEICLVTSYIFLKKYDVYKLVVIILFLSIAEITYIKTGSSSFLVMLFTAIICENQQMRRITKKIFYTRSVLLGLIIGLSWVGVLDVYKRDYNKSIAFISSGYGFGFTHPNRLGFNFIFLILLFACYKNTLFKRKEQFVIIVITLMVFLITGSRTLLLSVTLFSVLVFVSKRMISNRRGSIIFQKAFPLVPLLCSLVSIVIPLLMLSASGRLQTILYSINGLFSSRFTHIYRAFLNYPITLFGGTSNFTLMESIYNYSTVDNGYIRVLYNYGIFGFVIYNTLSFVTIWRLAKAKEYVYVSALVVLSIWGLSENILLSVAFNLFPLFWGVVLHKGKKKIKKNEKQ